MTGKREVLTGPKIGLNQFNVQQSLLKYKDDELIRETQGYYESIFTHSCYDISDLVWFNLLIYELERRDFRLYITTRLSISKK